MSKVSTPEALKKERDSKLAKEVSLSYIVQMCQDCIAVCHEKTLRFVTDSSAPAKGWEREYREFAEDRRNDEIKNCLPHCELVKEVCPTPELIDLYEAQQRKRDVEAAAAAASSTPQKSGGWFGRGGNSSSSKATPSPLHADATNLDGSQTVEGDAPISTRNSGGEQVWLPNDAQMRRCVHVVERWTQQLFNMQTKPSKLVFNIRDPKSGDEYDPLTQKKIQPNKPGVVRDDVTHLVLHNAGSSTASGKPAAHLALGEGGTAEGDAPEGTEMRKTQRWALMLRAKHDTAGARAGASVGGTSPADAAAAYRQAATATDAASMFAGDGQRAVMQDAASQEGGQASHGTVPKW